MGFLLVLSCVAGRPGASDAVHSGRAPGEALRQRAERLWEARRREDWATVYLFRDPNDRDRASEADFIAWCQEQEPFVVHSYRLGDVLTDGTLGWVEVHSRVGMRRFPKVPPREAHRWEKWRRVRAQWFPVPGEELASYPASPVLRNLAEEARLLTRVQESWLARQAQDWHGLYGLCDPRDRSEVSEAEFAQAEGLFEYVSYDIQWVEVVDRRGNARVAYHYKLDDPSLTKLPPKIVVRNERWVKVDNEWFLALSRP